MALEGPRERDGGGSSGDGAVPGWVSAGGEESRGDAVALRLFPRPAQHFNQSGASASC